MHTAQKLVSALALATASAFSLSASAQTAVEGFASQHLNPAPNQRDNGYAVHSAQTLTPNQWHAGILFNYADDPLRVGDGNDWRAYRLTSGQFVSDIHGAIGLFRGFELGMAIPVIWVHNGDDLTTPLGVDNSGVGIGAGDIRIVPKYTFFDRAHGRDKGSALALLLDFYVPSGDEETFRGGELRAEPRLAYHHDFSRPLRVSANVGWRIRPEREIGDIEVNDSLTWGFGVNSEVEKVHGLEVFGELFGEFSVLADDFDKQEAPLEALLGVRYTLTNGIAFNAGGGTGIIRGFSAPDWRIIGGIAVSRTGKSQPRDSDGDGISDNLDNCPNVANTDQLDSDGDGVGDACTFDTDGDGIADHRDACPDKAEDYDGVDDEDGCPEDGEGDVRLTCDQIEIGQRIEFEFDSSTLLDSSKAILDQVATVLRGASHIREIRIEGHADQIGDPDYNRSLSQRRADSVRDYLVSQRVSRSRLKTQGFGADRPLTTDADPEAQAQNRRVEFHVVAQDNANCED